MDLRTESLTSPVQSKTESQQSWFKNLNVYWWGVTGLAVWFLFVHTPPLLTEAHKWKDILVVFHVICAGSLYFACSHNSLVTPSVHRELHVWVGRGALLLGVLGFISGAVLVFGRFDQNGGTFGILISLAGCLQMYMQWMGYRAIKEYQRLKASIASTDAANDLVIQYLTTKQHACLKSHISAMMGLFVLACGVPAFIRVFDDAHVKNATIALVASITGLNFVHHFYVQGFVKPMNDPSTETTREETSEGPPNESTTLLA